MTDPDARYVSTGALPPTRDVARLVQEAYEVASRVTDGACSTVYPALAGARPDLLGVSVVSIAGDVEEAGDSEASFPIMSVAKPFVFALVCDELGAAEAKRRIGANATGLAFNALEPIERDELGRTNPMVNSGAIATTSLVPGTDHEERWTRIVELLSVFAGRALTLNVDVYDCATETNVRNREIVDLLARRGGVHGDPAGALDLYTRQSCVDVTAHDLAVMGATLANGGRNPITGARGVAPDSARHALAVMTTAGLYETSGDWLYEVGLPGKSGIGGGIVTVSPGKGGLGTYSPPLDEAGNSVRGGVVARLLSRWLGLDLFASAPVSQPDQPSSSSVLA